MIPVHVVEALDANFAWDGEQLYEARDFAPAARVPVELRGAAASLAFESPSSWRIVRDPLGINKVFWASAPDSGAALASRPKRLVEQGYAFDAIRAIPRGSVIDLSDGRLEPEVHRINWAAKQAAAESSLSQLADTIRSVLDRYLMAVAEAHRGADFFVCLSGGLDSSGIAALARERIPGIRAVSFDLERPHEESDDRLIARRLAADLELPLICVTASPTSLLDKLDIVLEEGVDWRDFNVHAGLVNAAIAEAIAVSGGKSRKIVLTGDLANEFLADYGEERYRGATYYELPRLRGRTLRAALVRGLDTSNREVGVFAAWGMEVVQPYAVAVDFYLSLPPSLLESPVGKQSLGRAIFRELLPDYIYARPKVRAQVGSSQGDRGVLGLCIDHGVDAQYLRDRFAHLHGVRSDALDHFIRGGTYRSGTPTLVGLATP
jgi:asparagine synthetase B (glutamine-hydrolysing)